MDAVVAYNNRADVENTLSTPPNSTYIPEKFTGQVVFVHYKFL